MQSWAKSCLLGAVCVNIDGDFPEVISFPSGRRSFRSLFTWICKDRWWLTVHWYIHTFTNTIVLKDPNKKSFSMKLSLTVRCTQKRKMDWLVNVLKGHFRLQSIAHHRLASHCYTANHRQGVCDAVYLLLEGFRGTAAWRCFGLNSSASSDFHTSCSLFSFPCLQGFILQAVHEVHRLCVF